MKREATAIRLIGLRPLLTMLGIACASAGQAQVPVDEHGNPIAAIADDMADNMADGISAYDETAAAPAALTASELDEVVGPIALYPDDLLAIVLPASTYPLEIVQAARFLDDFEQDSSLQPDEDWDESVVALLNYPEVLRMMDEDIDWTWRLGEAVISQQPELIAAIESFRDRAYAAGNLKSDEHQNVTVDDGVIEIEPVDEEIIYVPYYEPAEVVVYQPRRVYYYYPEPCPVYYYPYPVGYRFRSGFFWGVTTAFSIGWATDHLHVYHPSYWGHPYYGRYYYGHYYRRPSIHIYNSYYVSRRSSSFRHRYRDGDYWRPRRTSGPRPTVQRVRNYEYQGRERDPNRRSGSDVRPNRIAGLNLRSRDDVRHNGRSDNRVTLPTRRDAASAERRSRVSTPDDNRTTRTVPRTDRSGGRDQRRSDDRNNGNNGQVVTSQRRPSTTGYRSDARAELAGRARPERLRSSNTRTSAANQHPRTAVAERRVARDRAASAGRTTISRTPPASRPVAPRQAPPARPPARSDGHRSQSNRQAPAAAARREGRSAERRIRKKD